MIEDTISSFMNVSISLQSTLTRRARQLSDLVRCRAAARHPAYRALLTSTIARYWRVCTAAERLAAFRAARRPLRESRVQVSGGSAGG
jgi:hypothetical protein